MTWSLTGSDSSTRSCDSGTISLTQNAWNQKGFTFNASGLGICMYVCNHYIVVLDIENATHTALLFLAGCDTYSDPKQCGEERVHLV